MKKMWKLLVAILICQLAGVIGSIFTAMSVKDWYVFLAKPSLNPPSWVFSPVWISLFLLMGISLYLIWTSKEDKKKKKGKSEKKCAYELFASQLLLNMSWSLFFFGLKSPMAALLNILVLWMFIALTILKFYKISKTASYLLIPYLAWVTFAAFLNYAIVMLN